MSEDNKELYRYLISIHGPPEIEHQGRTQYYDTDEFGQGTVSIYKVLEGNLPFGSFSIGHLSYVSDFKLKSEENKTLAEFMQEVKKGIEKFVSSSESE